MLKAIRLQTENLYQPLGLDEKEPCFSWNLAGNGKLQTAYRLRIAHTPSEDDSELWTGEKRLSSAMTNIPCPVPLHSRERIFWQVQVWDELDQPGEWSEWAWFEMGLLDAHEWTASWIAGDFQPESGKRYPADEFLKRFEIRDVAKARLYMTACGVYEAHINGSRVGNQILTPGSTSYDKRIHYQVYDVTELLHSGRNEWTITLGDGWFRGKMGAFGKREVYGLTTCALGQLEILDPAGNRVTIVTDGDFAWSNDGPIRFNDMKDGETIDGSMKPGYGGKARVVQYETTLCCSNSVPVVEKEVFTPEVLQTPDGSTVLDFRQNIAGYTAFSVKGTSGHHVVLHMGEMLDEQGNFTVANIINDSSLPYVPDDCDDSRFQTVHYICGSARREYWKPKFTVQGFRYVKLENWPEPVVPEHFQAIAVYSDLEVTEEFHCSSGDLEKLVQNTLWSMKGNFLDVPTDCPTRERSAWLGDAQLFFDTGSRFMDLSAFFRKWIRDIYDDQAPDGKVYNIVPRCGPRQGAADYVEGSSGWTDAGILLPYRFWRRCGDLRPARRFYDGMKKLADYMIGRMGVPLPPEAETQLEDGPLRPYIVSAGFHFGEWNEPDTGPETVMTPKFEEATAYLSYSLRCFSELAQAIGHEEDARHYGMISTKAAEAYRAYFLKDGQPLSCRMCKFVRPLALSLVEGEEKEELQKGLLKIVRENHYNVTTGFLSTPFLLEQITRAGDLEAAYRVLENPEYPGWIYEVRQGATTVWENWDGIASRNHYSNGACCDWVMGTVCGIRACENNHFCLAPQPGGSLTSASLSWLSRYGKVTCAWEKQNQDIQYTVTVPPGCTATLCLDHEYNLQAGSWRFTQPMEGGQVAVSAR